MTGAAARLADANDFAPGDAATWVARGRSPEHAEALAKAWRDFPDLPADRPLDERMTRTRERVVAIRPVHDAIAADGEAKRRARNFAFMEGKAQAGTISDRDLAILHGRDRHGYGWDDAVRYAGGWYAAHAGWAYDPRPHLTSRHGRDAGREAYDRGFADGGGAPADLFDVARRQIEASTRASNHPVPAPPARPARPLPSSWPLPTDQPRPSRWSRRLLILSQGEARGWPTRARQPSPGPMELLAGLPDAAGMTIVMLIAERGFVDARTTEFTTSEPAAGWADRLIALPSLAASLRSLIDGRDFDDILVTAQGDYLRVVDAASSVLPLCRTMERTRNTPLQQRAHFRTWVERGRSGDGNRGAGHIRWSKLAKGLSGKLGEFTARVGSSRPGHGHSILIELADGVPAFGFVAADGRPLNPEIVIGNKATMRQHMALALRSFTGATRT
ncbi:hypothetical protein [Sphingomonas bacterium]|uniref:hypothetical protein n=1 Tax=Sphingomonas bacterium TaxID=1895847 RepID=UPI001576591F|nr:hypothetical protein [Sphingomonas bacterium]